MSASSDTALATGPGVPAGAPSARPVGRARVRTPGGRGRPADYLELTKPRITLLVVATAAAGFLAASSGGGAIFPALLWALAGTALLAGGTNALNQLLERDADARMERTRRRPLPAGHLSPRAAAAFSAALVALGTLVLAAWTNVLTAGLGLLTVASYAFVYTPLKRVTPAALLVGAVPGALPVLGGWTAARGSVDAGGVALFGILFLWQVPHFLALGWLHREDYRRAGFSLLPAGEGADGRSGRRALGYAAALVPAGLLPALLGLAGDVYFTGALVAGTVYAAAAATFARGPTRSRASRLFGVSLIYLPAVMLLLILDGPVAAPLLAELAGSVAGAVAAAPPQATLNAGLNGATAVALAAGFHFVRRGRIRAHRAAMLVAVGTSGLFLVSYVVYHLRVGSVSFAGTGWLRTVYLGILISHAVLAATVVPLVLVTLARALRGRRQAHRKIARWTLPVWAYVSVTGLAVYLMLYVAGR